MNISLSCVLQCLLVVSVWASEQTPHSVALMVTMVANKPTPKRAMLTFEKGNKVQKNSGAELRVTIRNMRPQDEEVVLEWYFIGRERQMPWEEKKKQETVCQRGSETLALSGGKNVTQSVQCNTSHTGSGGGWTSTAYDRVDITGWLVVLRDKDGAVLKSSASKPNLETLLKDKAKFDEFLTRKP